MTRHRARLMAAHYVCGDDRLARAEKPGSLSNPSLVPSFITDTARNRRLALSLGRRPQDALLQPLDPRVQVALGRRQVRVPSLRRCSASVERIGGVSFGAAGVAGLWAGASAGGRSGAGAAVGGALGVGLVR